MRCAVLLFALLCIAMPGFASPTAPPQPEGVYGNVAMSRETGDLGGFEVRFVTEGDLLIAEHVLCEGWCNQIYRSIVSRDGTAFVFGSTEELAEGGENVRHQWLHRVTVVGKRLRLESWYADQAANFGDGEVTLRKLRRPFGLAVAQAER